MMSGTVMYTGRGVSYVQDEMQDLNNQDAIVGYRMWLTWGAMEPSQGKYDFTVLDGILAKLKTSYNKPKHLVVGLWLYGQSALGTNNARVFPLYVQQNKIYGASPVNGSFGWWGKNANGASTGMYAPALYYAPVMDRLIALVQALGKHLDNEPLFEGIIIQENATIGQAASGLGSTDPNYSDAAWLAQLQRLLTAATAAFPHTSVVMQNSWFDRPPSGVTLQQWMATNRIAPGTADSYRAVGNRHVRHFPSFRRHPNPARRESIRRHHGSAAEDPCNDRRAIARYCRALLWRLRRSLGAAGRRQRGESNLSGVARVLDSFDRNGNHIRRTGTRRGKMAQSRGDTREESAHSHGLSRKLSLSVS